MPGESGGAARVWADFSYLKFIRRLFIVRFFTKKFGNLFFCFFAEFAAQDGSCVGEDVDHKAVSIIATTTIV